MNRQKGFASLLTVLILAGAMVLVTFLVTKAIYKSDSSAVTVLDGSSSDDPTVMNFLNVPGRLYGKNSSTGGLFSTTTTSTTGTVTAASLLDARTYVITPNVSDVTLTLPASSTLSELIPNRGDRASFMFFNSTTTGSIEVTLAGASGTILSSASTTRLILPGKAAIVEFMRSASSTGSQKGDIYVYMLPSGL